MHIDRVLDFWQFVTASCGFSTDESIALRSDRSESDYSQFSEIRLNELSDFSDTVRMQNGLSCYIKYL